jgi:hypothetical protein
VDVYNPIITEVVVAPHSLEQLLSSQNAPGSLCQRQEKIELYGRQIYPIIAYPDTPGSGVNS